MRTLKLQVQITVDGFIAGPKGEMDWMCFNWTDDIKKYVGDLTTPVGTILLGRKLAEGFIPHWASRPAYEDPLAIDKFNDTPKVVFTRSLPTSPWPNTTIATADLTTEINRLKAEPGGDIIAYGGSAFVSSLIEAGLIDEYHLFINPVAIGIGMPIFADLQQRQPLTLVKATPFACGIVVMHYRRS